MDTHMRKIHTCEKTKPNQTVANSRDSVASRFVFEDTEESDEKARAGTAQRMAERYCTPEDVHFS